MRWIVLVVIWLFGFETLSLLRENHYYGTVIVVFLVLIAITIGICSAPKNTNSTRK